MKKLKQNYFKGKDPRDKKNQIKWFSISFALLLIIFYAFLILEGHG